MLCLVFSNISVIFENKLYIPYFDSSKDVLNDFKTKAFRERLARLLPKLKLFLENGLSFSVFWNRERFPVTQQSTSAVRAYVA